MDKKLDYVVAVILKRSHDSDEFLVVKRPADDPDLRGSWGFPATTLRPGELPEDAVRRVCKEKLGCSCEITRFLGIMFQRRNSYDLFLIDIEAELTGSEEPDIKNANTAAGNTVYVEQKWTADPNDLVPAANHGSCCASIFLTDCKLLSRAQWIESLEGSDLVA